MKNQNTAATVASRSPLRSFWLSGEALTSLLDAQRVFGRVRRRYNEERLA